MGKKYRTLEPFFYGQEIQDFRTILLWARNTGLLEPFFYGQEIQDFRTILLWARNTGL